MTISSRPTASWSGVDYPSQWSNGASCCTKSNSTDAWLDKQTTEGSHEILNQPWAIASQPLKMYKEDLCVADVFVAYALSWLVFNVSQEPPPFPALRAAMPLFLPMCSWRCHLFFFCETYRRIWKSWNSRGTIKKVPYFFSTPAVTFLYQQSVGSQVTKGSWARLGKANFSSQDQLPSVVSGKGTTHKKCRILFSRLGEYETFTNFMIVFSFSFVLSHCFMVHVSFLSWKMLVWVPKSTD